MKKILLILLTAVFCGILAYFYEPPPPPPHWEAYEGRIAGLRYPKEWKIAENESVEEKYIAVRTDTPAGERLSFILVEFMPKSGISNPKERIEKLASMSAKEQPLPEKITLKNGLAAYKFLSYPRQPYLLRLRSRGGVSIQMVYKTAQHIVFKKENGNVCDLWYYLPEGKKERKLYEPIFQEMVESISF